MTFLDLRIEQVIRDLNAAATEYAPEIEAGPGGVDTAWNIASTDASQSTDTQIHEHSHLGALAYLLRHALEHRSADPVLQWVWEDRYADILKAPKPLAYALGHGVLLMQSLGFLDEAKLLPQAFLFTKTLEEVETGLIQVAKSATPEQIQAIAASDYGECIEAHTVALDALLASADLAYQDHMYWSPHEVLNLSSHVGSKQYVSAQDAFVPAFAIVLLWAVRNGDKWGDASARFCNGFPEPLSQLPKPILKAFLDAYRYWYESFEN